MSIFRKQTLLRHFARTIVLFFLCGCNSMFYYPSKKEYGDPDVYSFRFEDFFYFSQDNRLHGRLIYSASPQSPRVLVLLFHGNAQNLTAHYKNFIWAVEQGMDLFIFDYSGYGQSEGQPSRNQLHTDGLTTLNWVNDNLLPHYEKFVIIGQSLGGAVAAAAIQEWGDRDKIHLLILDSTFLYYRSAAKSAVSKSWITWPFQALVPILISESFSPGPNASKLDSINKWVTHCRDDNIVAFELGYELFQNLGGKKQFITAKNCGHIGIFKQKKIQNKLLCELSLNHEAFH